MDRRSSELARLRTRYDSHADEIHHLLLQMIQAVAASDEPGAARKEVAQVDAAIKSAVQTVVSALDLAGSEAPTRGKRLSKALRDQRQVARFWSRELMRLADLRTRLSWIALDSPEALQLVTRPPPQWFRTAVRTVEH